MSRRTEHAKELFAPLGPSYDRVGAVLSLGQDPLWRRFLVSRLPRDGGHVLDVATGTGLVAAELRRRGFSVTGLDQSPEMLEVAHRRFRGDGRVELVEGSAESLPFGDAHFDHLTVTYVMRYVDDPGATLTEQARVVRPGGTVASLEFGVPGGPARPLWDVYVGVVLPLAGRALRNGWDEVGDFLGPSIRELLGALPARAAARALARGRDPRRRGKTAQPRRRRGPVGHEDVRPSWYALERGGWRDYVSLLHLPYTAWHLSYVVIGGCLAPVVRWERLGAVVAAFALALGVGAHALDELRDRPLGTAIPDRVLVAARRGLDRRRLRHRDRRFRGLGLVARTARRGRSLPRPRVQPRARRRALPHGPLVRPRVGRLPGADRVRRCRRRALGRSRAGGGLRGLPLPRAARSLHERALRPPTSRDHNRRAGADGRHAHADRRSPPHRRRRADAPAPHGRNSPARSGLRRVHVSSLG